MNIKFLRIFPSLKLSPLTIIISSTSLISRYKFISVFFCCFTTSHAGLIINVIVQLTPQFIHQSFIDVCQVQLWLQAIIERAPDHLSRHFLSKAVSMTAEDAQGMKVKKLIITRSTRVPRSNVSINSSSLIPWSKPAVCYINLLNLRGRREPLDMWGCLLSSYITFSQQVFVPLLDLKMQFENFYHSIYDLPCRQDDKNQFDILLS